MTTPPTALALEGISKRFGSVTALSDVSLRVQPGHVHALLGENGAGKTTLMHVAFGMVAPDAGIVRVHGERRHVATPADAIAAGIGMVHQHFTLVPAMTVAENIALGGRGLLHRAAMDARVHAIAAAMGFVLDPSARVETLSVGAQQRVEIAKALAREARVLILDEPTAVLAPAEAQELLHWLRRFTNAGNAVVLITHKLQEALAVSDHVTVLRRGCVVHDGAARDTTAAALTNAMVGVAPRTPPSERAAAPAPDNAPRDVALEARRIAVRDERDQLRVRDVSLAVHHGEIVGVAGVEGAGQHELLRALAGRLAIEGGTLESHEPIGFVPEDRHRDAILLDRSLTENVALRGAGQRHGRMTWRNLRDRTAELMREFDVRAPGPDAPMRSLSGGNQQKLVLAREMGDDPRRQTHSMPDVRTLIVENPTRGLDVRATSEVHARLRAARTRGDAIILYSSDLDEVLSLADRIVVLHDGTLREVPIDREAVGRAMLGTP